MTTDVSSPVKATRKEWIGLAVIALPCLLYSMDLTVLNLAIPSLSMELKPSASQLLWIVDIYGFLIAGSLITMGTLGDRIGRRKLLLIGAALFGMASAFAAFSNSASTLIVTRALLGIAGATLAPSTLSLIRNMFHDPAERAMAMGVWGTSFSVGGAIGPLLGGLLIQNFWWGSVFLINIPVMVLLILIGPFFLPEYKDPDAGRLDILSAALSLVAILAIIFGLKHVAEDGPSPLAFGAIALGLAIGFAFIRRQKLLADPLIDLKLFKSSTFNFLVATNILSMFTFFGLFIFVAQYLQMVLGLSPLMAGLWSLPSSAGFIVSAMASPLLAKKIRPAYLMTSGLLITGLGFLVFTQIEYFGLMGIVIGSVLQGLGASPVVLFVTNMIVSSVPPEKAGSAAALSETSNELGGALGIAVLGSVGTFVYRRELSAVLPTELSAGVREGTSSTLGSALSTASELAPELSAQVTALARAAFTHSFAVVSIVAATVMFSLAVLVITRLRHVKLE